MVTLFTWKKLLCPHLPCTSRLCGTFLSVFVTCTDTVSVSAPGLLAADQWWCSDVSKHYKFTLLSLSHACSFFFFFFLREGRFSNPRLKWNDRRWKGASWHTFGCASGSADHSSRQGLWNGRLRCGADSWAALCVYLIMFIAGRWCFSKTLLCSSAGIGADFVVLFADRKWDILLQVQFLSEPSLMLCLHTFLSSFPLPLCSPVSHKVWQKAVFIFLWFVVSLHFHIFLNSCVPSLIHEWLYDRREIVRAAPSPRCIWSNLLCRSFARLPKGA